MSAHYFLTSMGLLLCACAAGQAGGLDPDFNNTGLATADHGVDHSYGYDVEVQPDGRIVVIGNAYSTGQPGDIALARYLPNGTLDGSFGIGGMLTTTGSPYFNGSVGALQVDGRIVVGATSEVGSDNVFALVRFEADGSMDGSFGTGGQAVANIVAGGASGESVFAIAIQTDGKILLAGRTAGGDASDMAVARFHADGTLDASFSDDGILVLPVSTLNDQVRSICIQQDGRILLVGGASFGTAPNVASRFALVRLLENGSLDGSFGSNGVSTIPIGSGSAFAMDAIIQADSRILATGYSGYPGLVTLVRCLPDGSLDGSFGVGGVATTFIATENSTGKGAALQSDGKILVTAECWDGFGTQYYSALLRYTSTGALDDSFGTFGISLLQFPQWSPIPESIAIQSDGKIVTSGYAITASATESMVVRYLNDLDIGILEFASGPELVVVYPNPIEDQTMLRYTLLCEERLTITIHDATGRLVRSVLSEVLRTQGTHQDPITIGDLSSGSYTLLVSNGHARTSVGLIKD